MEYKVKALLTLFAITCITRLIFFNLFLRDNPVRLSFDSGHYHTAAIHIAESKGFSTLDGSPYFYRLPGYPLFLAVWYKMFGIDPLYALCAQSILGSVIPLTVYALSLALFPGACGVAWGAAICTALHPGFLILSGLVMSETLFIFLFLLFLLLLLRSDNRWWMLLGSGACLGAASLVRPLGLWLLVLASCYYLYVNMQCKKSWGWIVFFIVGWISFVGAWVIRNFFITGVFFLHTFLGPHVLNHGAVRVLMHGQSISYEQARKTVDSSYRAMLDAIQLRHHGKLQEIETSRCALVFARRIFILYPVHTARLCFFNMLKTCFALYSAELLFIDSGGQLPAYDSNRGLKDMMLRFLTPQVKNGWIRYIIFFEIVFTLLLWIGCFGFLLRLIRDRSWHVNCIVPIFLSMLFIALSCMCGFARLRLPIEAFLFMLSLMFWIPEQHGKRVV